MRGGPFISSILKSVGFDSSMKKEPRLCELLDTDGTDGQEKTIQLESDSDPSSDHYSDHVARLNAEEQTHDNARRLQVAQEQFADFAQQREEECQNLLEYVQKTISGLSLESDSAVSTALQQIRDRLESSASEAAAFSALHKADVERAKRSFSQLDIHKEPSDDLELKRQRALGLQGETDNVNNESASSTDAAFELKNKKVFIERSKYIPLRLTLEERRLLRLLEAALSVSEYTDQVDIQSWRGNKKRIQKELLSICGILCGLVVAEDYKAGQNLVTDRHFADNAEFFQGIFEIGRRHKIMNPDKMRSEYGKLMYMLMDAADPTIQDLIDFNPIKDLNTVYNFLEERDALDLLQDPLMTVSTKEILTINRSRSQIQMDIREKELARDTLAKKYKKNNLDKEDILNCLYSISDNNSFLLFNRDPIDRLIDFMNKYFKANEVEANYSLSINMGMEGARLSHNHERQYHYVMQSLLLWREISHDMFKLWLLAETDLLASNNTYRLTNTGQGYNRLQQVASYVEQAPRVHREMVRILHRCQQNLGSWVGSSVIHLGDSNVPNALMFIDKYNQVPRILTPVVMVLDELPKMEKDPLSSKLINLLYGDVETARKNILLDLFRHGFDGSGADNFFDAGSCIDGRLTSLWNWASKIEKKPYYCIFKLAGFTGFDGDFQK